MHKVYHYGFDAPYRLELTPLYTQLRSEEPVARVKLPYGEEGWLATRHASVKTVLADERFNRAAVVAAHERTPRSSPIPLRNNPLSAVNPPEHTRLRQPVAAGLGRQPSELFRPSAQRIADELLEGIIAAGPPVDVVDAFATRFPIMSLGEFLGVPQSDRIKFHEWSIPTRSQTSHTAEEIEAAYRRMREYITALVARKREQPDTDVLSSLVHVKGDRQFTNEQVVSIAVSLLLNDSVANQIANCLYLLFTHPDQLAWLQAHMSELPQAVEELLRFAPLSPDTPGAAQGHVRMAMEDLTLDGATIRAGDFVLPSIISANRDEQVFTDAHKLDLTRPKCPHLAFGHGYRRCPGDKVSRMLMQVAMGSLVARFPDLRLAMPVDEVPWKIGMITRSPTKLLVHW
jgi:nocardicin N-oxygenase